VYLTVYFFPFWFKATRKIWQPWPAFVRRLSVGHGARFIENLLLVVEGDVGEELPAFPVNRIRETGMVGVKFVSVRQDLGPMLTF
jgi:hypothetical protein